MRFRHMAAGLLALAALSQSGCAALTGLTAATPNPLVVPANVPFETVWNKTVAVVDDYFEISHENRLAGTMVTDPRVGATLLEPWYGDSVDFYERLESSLQTIRRHARVTVKPASTGGYTVNVEVFKELEDLAKPERQTAARAIFADTFNVNRTREVVGPVSLPNGWIPLKRDTKLECVILNRLRSSLYLP
jgi:hypothetical protein